MPFKYLSLVIIFFSLNLGNLKSENFSGIELGNNWYHHPQFGIFYDIEGSDWHYHLDHKWIYVEQWDDNGTWIYIPLEEINNDENNSFSMQKVPLGWMWTNANHYPILYNNEIEDWFYYNKNQNNYYCYPLKNYITKNFILKTDSPNGDWRSLEPYFFIEDYKNFKVDYLSAVDDSFYAGYWNITIPYEELSLDVTWSALIQGLLGNPKELAKRGIKKIEYKDNSYKIKFGVSLRKENGEPHILIKPSGSRSIVLSNNPQLFLDDHLVAKSTNLGRRINRPIKHPANPLIKQDLPWEKRTITIYGTVLYDQSLNKFRCWYLASEFRNGISDIPDGPVTSEYFICYAESDNGIDWNKPLLSDDRFGLHDKHNIVIPDGHGFSVLHEPDDYDPKRHYKGAGGAIFGFSPDGIKWNTQNWRNAVGKNDTSTSIIKWRDEYLAFVRYQVEDPNWSSTMRGIGLSSSQDFNKWSPKELIFRTDEKDGYPWTQPYGLAVTPYGDLLLGILWLIRLDKIQGNNSLGDEDTELIVSRDGRNWQRVSDRARFLEPTQGSWDEGRIHAPATQMFIKDDVVHIYYGATNTRHGSGDWGKPGIGLATLPADRFVALHQQDSNLEAILETPPLRFDGSKLLVNANIDPSDLQVELLNAEGNVLSGFDRNSCQLRSHDKLRWQINWASDTSISNAMGLQPLIFRFILRAGELYAFQIVK